MSRLVSLEVRSGQANAAGLRPGYGQLPSLDGVVDLAWVDAQHLGRFGYSQERSTSGTHDISPYPIPKVYSRALRP